MYTFVSENRDVPRQDFCKPWQLLKELPLVGSSYITKISRNEVRNHIGLAQLEYAKDRKIARASRAENQTER